MTVAHLLQLPSVRAKFIFSQVSDKDGMKHLSGLQLCHLFNHIYIYIYIYAKLTKAARQNNELFIDLLSKVCVGNIDDNAEKLLKIHT